MLTFIPTHTLTRKKKKKNLEQVRRENEEHKPQNWEPFDKELFPVIQIPSPLGHTPHFQTLATTSS